MYTQDLTRAMRLASLIEAGMVAVNRGRVSCVAAPFGGVKRSGYGHSGAAEGIDEYLVTRYLTMPAPGAERHSSSTGWESRMDIPFDGRSGPGA